CENKTHHDHELNKQGAYHSPANSPENTRSKSK
uniref:Uncharacterized protein n=1 Tax=Ciona intestinalis TaxID=7719 RepID=H2Y375_CIOIN